MANDIVHTVVDRKGYVYRGTSLSKGQIVRMTAAQFDASQRIRPPYFRKATAAELKAAETEKRSIVDLATVQAAAAENVAEAETALETNAPPPKKK